MSGLRRLTQRGLGFTLPELIPGDELGGPERYTETRRRGPAGFKSNTTGMGPAAMMSAQPEESVWNTRSYNRLC